MSKFSDVKEAYTLAREVERKRIIDYLVNQKDENGKRVFKKGSKKARGQDYKDNGDGNQGGQGRTDYGKNRFGKAYNLSNFKYIETECCGKYVLISLQSFDISPCSRNILILYDRIGIFIGENSDGKVVVTDGNQETVVSDMFLKMEVTDYELPLSESDLSHLIEDIMKRCQ